MEERKEVFGKRVMMRREEKEKHREQRGERETQSRVSV